MTPKQKQKLNIYRRANNKNNTNGKVFLSVFNKFLLILILASGIYFVGSINDLSIKGFVLRELKDKTAALGKKNSDYQLRVMELESYDRLSRGAQDISMVKVDKMEYITIKNGEVAVR